jgi:hypothetical protein
LFYCDPELITDPEEQVKSLYYDKDEFLLYITGIYYDDVRGEDDVEEKYVRSAIDSIFKVIFGRRLSAPPYNFKYGDWFRIKACERELMLVREFTPID